MLVLSPTPIVLVSEPGNKVIGLLSAATQCVSVGLGSCLLVVVFHCHHKISLAFCISLVVVVLRYEDAAWVGTWTYFFSFASSGGGGGGAAVSAAVLLGAPASVESSAREKQLDQDLSRPSGEQVLSLCLSAPPSSPCGRSSCRPLSRSSCAFDDISLLLWVPSSWLAGASARQAELAAENSDRRGGSLEGRHGTCTQHAVQMRRRQRAREPS